MTIRYTTICLAMSGLLAGANAEACDMSLFELPAGGPKPALSTGNASLDAWSKPLTIEWHDATSSVCNVLEFHKISADGSAQVSWYYPRWYDKKHSKWQEAGSEDHDIAIQNGGVNFKLQSGHEVLIQLQQGGAYRALFKGQYPGVVTPMS